MLVRSSGGGSTCDACRDFFRERVAPKAQPRTASYWSAGVGEEYVRKVDLPLDTDTGLPRKCLERCACTTLGADSVLVGTPCNQSCMECWLAAMLLRRFGTASG